MAVGRGGSSDSPIPQQEIVTVDNGVELIKFQFRRGEYLHLLFRRNCQITTILQPVDRVIVNDICGFEHSHGARGWIECEKSGDKVIITIAGNRFLYNMVRTIVGTLLEIEGHNLPAEHMKEVLEAKDRRKAGQTVSPYGLTLIKVEY